MHNYSYYQCVIHYGFALYLVIIIILLSILDKISFVMLTDENIPERKLQG